MKKILVVEDDIFLLKIYQAKLKKAGYEVNDFENGTGVLESIKAEKPDLMLLDLVMPEKDGFQVLKELQDEKVTGIPILIISNLGQKEDIDKAKNFGIEEYMVKVNFSFKQILDKIKEIIP